MKRLIFCSALSFLAGSFVASCFVYLYMHSRLEHDRSLEISLTAESYLAALAPLRSGDTNAAIRRLHVFLDARAGELGEMPQSEIVTSTLGRVKFYRTQFPYISPLSSAQTK